ncbi:hypothetical protein G3O08_16065 [Cryomorpha ignava]|uniref:DUF3108 domain-containing protein n=1 Tax=Cryomorpha ignava TaxID=101383 RepID=A0A7K3WTK0_9FLAO|nr:DUF6567 family protein [Cryomorpha ignava]NEN25017.1 hypothetical protein [Cryomorpha ignava]
MKSVFTLRTIFFGLFLSSCAFHGGMMTGNASLSGGDFEIISIESGMAKTTHIFGIGGLDHQALVFEAKKNLYKSCPLKKGQALANVTVDFKRSLLIVVATTRVTVTADLVQYGNAIDTTIQRGVGIYSEPINFVKSDTVAHTRPFGYFTSNQIAAIFKHKELVPVRILNGVETSNGKYNIEFLEPARKSEVFIRRSDLYLVNKSDGFPHHKFKVGDPVKFFFNTNIVFQNGVITAIGTDKAIVKSGVSTYELDLVKLIPVDLKPTKD